MCRIEPGAGYSYDFYRDSTESLVMAHKPLFGLFGGTFDPIHNGHLETVLQLTRLIAFDRVSFIPAAIPPHKSAPDVSATHRLDMVELACAPYPDFIVDDIELKRQTTSYTIDTLLNYRQTYPDATLTWIMGMDALLSFNKWHRFNEILNICHLIVMRRPQWSFPQDIPSWWQPVSHANALRQYQSGKILFVDTPQIDISSTQIRKALKNHEPINHMLPPAVLNYIYQNHLYQYDSR